MESSNISYLDLNSWPYYPYSFTPPQLTDDELTSPIPFDFFSSPIQQDPSSPIIKNETPPLNQREISVLSQPIPHFEIFSYTSQSTLQISSPMMPTPQESIPCLKQEVPIPVYCEQTQISKLDIPQIVFPPHPFLHHAPSTPSSSNFSNIQAGEKLTDPTQPNRRRSRSESSEKTDRPRKSFRGISEEEQTLKKEIRRDKNRQSAHNSRARVKRHIQELETERSDTVDLGKKVEECVEHYRSYFPTFLSSEQTFSAKFEETSREISEESKKVKGVQQRIKQVVKIVTKEAIKAEEQKKEALARNAELELRVRQLEIEANLFRLHAAIHNHNYFNQLSQTNPINKKSNY